MSSNSSSCSRVSPLVYSSSSDSDSYEQRWQSYSKCCRAEIERLLNFDSESKSDRNSFPEEGSQSNKSDGRSSRCANSRRRRRSSVDRRSSTSDEDKPSNKKRKKTRAIELELQLKEWEVKHDELVAMRKERLERKRILREESKKHRLSRIKVGKIDSEVESKLPICEHKLLAMKNTLLAKLYSGNGSLTPVDEKLLEKVNEHILKKK